MTKEERQLVARAYFFAATVAQAAKEALTKNEFTRNIHVMALSLHMEHDAKMKESTVSYMIEQSDEIIKDLIK